MGRGPTFGIRALDRARRRLARQDGFTMIEVMVAVLLLTVGVIGSVRSFDAANAATGRTKAREGGTNLAREVIEATRSIPYSKVLDGSLVDELQAQPGLGDARSGGGWEVRRRNITYTIDTSVCVVDDEREDGLGPHDSQAFCGAPGGTADVNPDDYKRVTVEVSWAEPTARGQVRQSTLMANPGTAAGPAVSDLSPETESPITTPATTVRFNVRTDTPAATVAWSVDGNHGGDADGSDTSWSFDWQISSLYDGAYLVSAQGFDQFGTGGAPRVYTMDLNRYAPLAPPGFTGGWNGSIVEFEWLPNAEGDIEGYRVYRQGSGPDELVCGLSTSTTCRDPAPPNQSSITYYVVAVDRDPSGNLRQGAPSNKAVTK
jgi:prepilin-type N-terminal cleavage/methylation domain-containing protein